MSSDLPKVVKFPELGPDIGVQFRFSDCEKIQEKLGENWFSDGIDAVGRFNAGVIKLFLSVGGKKGDVSHPIDAGEAVDKIGWEVVALRLADALLYSIKRKSMAEAEAEFVGAPGEARPPLSPETSSQMS